MAQVHHLSSPMNWNAEAIGKLCRLYMAGHRFQDIGAILGCTKNAAIGKFNRLVKEGHTLARQAAAVRGYTRMAQVADWMASYDGTIGDCARSLGISYAAAKAAWNRVCNGMGARAA